MITIKPVSIAILTSFLLFFFFAIFPYVPTVTYSYYDHHRIIQVVYLAFISVVCIGSIVTRSFVYRSLRVYSVLMVAFLALGIVSSIMSVEPVDSLMYVLHWKMLFILAVTATLLNSTSHLKLLFTGIVVVHSSVVLISLLNLMFAIVNGDKLQPFVIYYGFDNIRFFNQVQVFVLPLLLVSLRYSRLKNIVLFLLLANVLLVIIGGGRGALATWSCILILVYVFNSKLRLQVISAVIASIFAALIFVVIDRYLAVSVYGLRFEDSSSGRMDMWVGALESLQASGFIYGNGPGLFAYRFNNLIFSHPHNSLVEILSEWGGVALLILLYLVVFTLMRAISYLRANQDDIVTLTVFCSWFSGVGYSLVSGVIVMPVAQTLLFLSWGVLLGRLYQAGDQGKIKWSKGVITAISVLLAVCAVVYLQLICSSYLALDEFEPAMQGPRFWLSGDRNLSD